MMVSGQFLRFVVVGGIVTLTHFTVLILLVEIGRWNEVLSTTAAFLVAVSVSYALNAIWTFQMWGMHRRRAPRFLAVSLIGLVLNTVVFWLVLSLGAIYVMAQVVASGVVMFWNYEANRRFTFSTAHG